MYDAKKKLSVSYINSFLLYETLCYMANAMIMPSMIDVVAYLHAQKVDISLTVIAYMIGICTTPLLISPIADLIGKPKVLIGGCTLFCVANLLCPFSHNITEFIIFRLLQGIGQGFIFLGYTMIHDSFEDIAAVKLISIMGNITVIAPIIGPVLGSLVSVSLGWKFVFWLTGGVSLFSLFGLIKFQSKLIPSPKVIRIKVILQNYSFIIKNKKFLLGMGILTLIIVPSELWMIFSIIIVRTALHQSLFMYNVYIIMLVGATIIGSIVLRTIIHKFNFANIIKLGCTIFITGILASVIMHANSLAFVLCLSVSRFGAALFRSIISRRLMTDIHQDKNTISALFNLISSAFLILIVYFASHICELYGYSLFVFSMFPLCASLICFVLIVYFIRTDTAILKTFNNHARFM